MKKFSSLLLLLFLLIGFTSCSDKKSLQHYFVENAEKTGFSLSTIPMSILRHEGVQLSEKQEAAFEAISRVNLLFYKLDPNNTDEFSKQKQHVSSILKDNEYEELINFGTNGIVKYLGTDDSMDEIVVFLSNKEAGFAVARILGDDMTLEKFMELYKMTQQENSPINFNVSNITSLFSGQ